MRLLLEALLFGVGGLSAIGFSGYVLRRKMLPSAPDKCSHRRWSQWKVSQEVPIYLYPDVDQGKALPDRVDAQMSRHCLRCGLPQTRTVRGIDSASYK